MLFSVVVVVEEHKTPRHANRSLTLRRINNESAGMGTLAVRVSPVALRGLTLPMALKSNQMRNEEQTKMKNKL